MDVNNETKCVLFAFADVSQLDFNVTLFTDFLIVGGKLGIQKFYTELAVILLVLYLIVLGGNLVILTVVILDSRLHIPMYIFLSNLAFIDIVITTTVLPKMISVCLWNNITISFSGCFLQMYIYLSFQSAEGFLLSVMAYDRYVAVCNPLRYNSIITNGVCALLATIAWVLAFILPALSVILATQLPFCNNEIMYWFCDYPPVVTLSCFDTTYLIDLALACALVIMYFPFTFIVWTYSKIIASVCKISSSEGRWKAFSSCTSHLTIVLAFYFAHSCVYISAKAKNIHPNVLILISIVNSFLTPLMNPVLYTLRNKEIKVALRKLIHVNKGFP
ncbi:olfactory receptor 6N2-like [Megalops cyprinoides]|uniref:olfactory receptor 6N2-like n=1 Tax=Megalops cyprinoides TaxID=118141 RepID=UPI00186451FF|nr:olfactory receptor 6N2-like [Megalops cyprinoides]